jgi:predicted deacylase
MADVVMDLHSGGRSLRFHPMTTMTEDEFRGSGSGPRRARMFDAMLAWNADFHLTTGSVGSGPGLLAAEAERQGKVVITSELGSGAPTKATLHVAERGLRNALRRLGLLPGLVESRSSLGLTETVQLRATSVDCYALAPMSGLFEPTVEPGERVMAGQQLGRLHDHEHANRAPEPVAAGLAGVVAAVRNMPSTRQGDVVAVVGEVR